MFCLANTSSPSARSRSRMIAALDGFVAFATLESYGVVDARDDAICELASERLLRARKRAAARAACDERAIPSPRPLTRRTAPLAGKR